MLDASGPDEFRKEHLTTIPPARSFSRGPARFALKRAAEIALDTACENYIVKGLFSRGDLGVIDGLPGDGKTFVMLEMLRSIAAGSSFLGLRVKATPALYIGLEGAAGVYKRAYAVERQHGGEAPFYVATASAADFLSDDFRQSVLNQIANHEIGVVAIDTLARFLGTADENTNTGMAQALQFADRVSKETEAATIFVAHTGKDASKGLRGHSSIVGAVDFEILVSRDLDSGERSVKLKKVKDGEDGLAYSFDLQTVDLGLDDEGDQLTSCVARNFRRLKEEHKPRAKLTDGQKSFFGCVQGYIAEHGELMHPEPDMPLVRTVERQALARHLIACGELDGACQKPLGTVSFKNDAAEASVPSVPNDELARDAMSRSDRGRLRNMLSAFSAKGLAGSNAQYVWLIKSSEKRSVP